jgi:hypothetical protein
VNSILYNSAKIVKAATDLKYPVAG